jgi:hypothetical protein
MVCLVLVIAPTLASCGGNGEARAVTRHRTAPAEVPSTTSAQARTTASAQPHTFIPPPADAIVTMRRFSPVSLMWQVVFVEPDGNGLLTSLIGETAGAPHRRFHLSMGQLATLRRLIAAAKPVKPGPSKPGDYLYTLHLAGEAPISFEGPIPGRLHQLVNFLGALMLTYCC